MIARLSQILEEARKRPPVRVAVAVAEETSVLEAVRQAQEAGIATPCLVGDEQKIRNLSEKVSLVLADGQVVNEPEDVAAASRAAGLVRAGQADVLMKGHIHTDDFLRAVLNKEAGLRAGVVMSHVFILQAPQADRLIFVTDGAMNIAPDFVQKAEIILNAVYLARLFGYDCPKVAVLAAVELVNPAMPVTIEAAALGTMSERGQFPDCIVEGPLAMDNAVSVEAAERKRLSGPVPGRADILVVPNIEAGNILVKTFAHLGGGRLAGVLVGASAPVVLTSRADSAEAKMYSIAAAILMASLARAGRLKVGKVHY